MKRNLWTKIAGIACLTIFMGLIAAPLSESDEYLWDVVPIPKFFTKYEFNLGLDLQGGTQLTYDIDLSKVPKERESDIISGVEAVIRKRVDGLGVTEPVIQSSSIGEKKHVIIELPGISDIQEAIDIVGKVVQLQFKEEKTEFTEEETKLVEEKNQEIKKEAEGLLIKAKKETTPDLKNMATESKNSTFLPGEEFINYDELPLEYKESIKEDKLADNYLYPELIETDFSYGIAYVKEIEESEEKAVTVSHILLAYKDAERADTSVERTKEEAFAQAQKVYKELEEGKDFIALSDEYSDDIVSKENEGKLEEAVTQERSPYVEKFTNAALALEIGGFTEPIETKFGYHIIKARNSEIVKHKRLKLEQIAFTKESTIPTGWADTGLTGEHFDFASASFNPGTGAPLVNIQFNEDGKDLFGEITKKNLNKSIAIFLDDKPIIGDTVYAPTVQSEITDGKAVITGIQSLEMASQLAQNLNTGAIPAPITLIGQSSVGATLGQNALDQALKAGLIGFIILALYMILYYRMSGLVAVLALGIYSTIFAGLLKMIGATMTLAGIAGVILSIGMAVDANILIFERMKEELSLGKSFHVSLEEGFKRAWTSIRDSNISSLITCSILFVFGTGIIRGFAVTLAFGVLISMFSAVTVTRNLLRIFLNFEFLTSKTKLFLPFVKKIDDNK